MKFLILNREQAHMFDSEKSHIIISITDPLSPNVAFLKSKTRKDVLRLKFHDFTKSDKEKCGEKLIEKGYVFFNVKMSKKIIKFVEKYKDKVELIIVHCEAGISRSAAVVAALAKCFGQPNMDYFKKYHPNTLVYWTILNEWFGVSYE